MHYDYNKLQTGKCAYKTLTGVRLELNKSQ